MEEKTRAWVMRNTILILACLARCLGARADVEWTPLDPANAPEARSGHTLTLFPDGQVRMFAGANTVGELFNDLAVFNGSEWISEQPVNDPPPARRDHAAWTMHGRLFIHQGLGAGNTVLSDLWAYNPSTRVWTRINSGGTPTPRHGHAAVPLPDDLVLLIGGQSQDGTALTDVWMLDSGYNHLAFDTAPRGFVFHNALRVDTLTYVFGQAGDMYSYYPSQRQWTPLAGAPRLNGHASAASSQNSEGRNFIHVFGGYNADGQESDVVHDYDIAANAWTQRVQRMPLSLVDSACVALPASGESSIFHFGGLSGAVAIDRSLLFTPTSGTPSPPAAGLARTITLSGDNPTIVFQGTPGQPYDVQRTTSLLAPVVWTTLTEDGPLIPDAGGLFDFTDPTGLAGAVYYRSGPR